MNTRKRMLGGLAGIALVLGGGLARAGNPPFTQCTAKGSANSCAVLITINPRGSLSYQLDPTVGPYDGIDDQLVGVVNQSGGNTISINLTGPDIFNCDGDGAGTSAFTDGGLNTFTCAGYQGPNTTFAVTNVSSGAVSFFAGAGLANGDHAWFSLEGRPTIPEVDVTKMFTNTTGQAIDEIQIAVAGELNVTQGIAVDGGVSMLPAPHITDSQGNAGWTEQVGASATSPTSVVDFRLPAGQTLLPNSTVTITFSAAANYLDYDAIAFLSSGAVKGCATQVGTQPPAGDPNQAAVITVDNFMGTVGTLCAQHAVFVGLTSVSWYSSPVPASQLLPNSLPSANLLRTDTVNVSPFSVPAGGTAQVPIAGPPPAGARSAVCVYSVGTTSSLTGPVTQDVAQFPIFLPATGCRSRADCPAGESCSNGQCVATGFACTTNPDCPAGQVCVNHVCAIPVVPAGPPWVMAMLLASLAGSSFLLMRRRSHAV